MTKKEKNNLVLWGAGIAAVWFMMKKSKENQGAAEEAQKAAGSPAPTAPVPSANYILV